MEASNSVNGSTLLFADYSRALLNGLSSMQTSSLYTDITLEAGGDSFRAHKNVLAAASNYFRLMFSHDFEESVSSIVKLPDISPTILKIVLTYIYSGNFVPTDDSVKDVLPVAHLMELSFLAEICQLFLKSNLKPENAVTTLHLSKLYELKDAAASSFTYMVDNFYKLPNNEILKLTSSELIELVNDDKLCVRQEDATLNVIVSWLEFTKEERYDVFFQLMRALRWSKLSDKYVNGLILKKSFRDTLCCGYIENMLSLISNPHKERSYKLPSLYIVANSESLGSTFLELDLSGTTVDLPKPPNCHSGHGCVLVENKFYVIGGSRYVDCYDTVKSCWISCSPMPLNIRDAVVVELDGIIYVCGGRHGNSHFNNVQRYDPKTDKWVEVASMINRRSFGIGTVLDGCIYIMGGWLGDRQISSCEYYDPEMDSWQSFTPLPSEVSSTNAESYRNVIYVIGGMKDSQRLDSLYKYDVNTMEWSSCPQIPFKTSHHISCLTNGNIYVIPDPLTKIPFFGIFDIASNKWQQMEINASFVDFQSFAGCSIYSGYHI